MATKHEQRAKAVAELVAAAKRAEKVRKAAHALAGGEVEEGEEA